MKPHKVVPSVRVSERGGEALPPACFRLLVPSIGETSVDSDGAILKEGGGVIGYVKTSRRGVLLIEPAPGLGGGERLRLIDAWLPVLLQCHEIREEQRRQERAAMAAGAFVGFIAGVVTRPFADEALRKLERDVTRCECCGTPDGDHLRGCPRAPKRGGR